MTMALLLVGCGLPVGDSESPTGAYYGWLASRAQGTAEALWPHLPPPSRSGFERWCKAERETVALLRADVFTPAQREAGLAALGGGSRALCEGGASLLGLLLGPLEPSPLGLFARLGAHVRFEENTDGEALLTTWAGDEVRVRMASDSRWFVVLPEPLSTKIDDAVDRALSNLRRVRAQHDRSASLGG